jgi:hypothetical protein
MRILRRIVPLAAAVVLLGLATVLALLAVDVKAWQRTMARDDVRFRTVHSRPTLWASPATLPRDPARALLGMSDGLAYRNALRLFWVSEVGVARAATSSGSGNLSQTRVDTQEQLQALTVHARTAAERSAAANMLGVMTVTSPASTGATQKETIVRAGEYFARAIVEDPSNWDARVNLELLLRLTKPDKSQLGKDARGGYGSGGSHGASGIGGGF